MLDVVFDILGRLGLLDVIQLGASIILAVMVFRYFTDRS